MTVTAMYAIDKLRPGLLSVTEQWMINLFDEGSVMRIAVIRAGIVTAILLGLLAAPAIANAGSADPASVAFGNVPLNTTVTRNVTITVDAGYRLELASGNGINAPFAFDF